MQTHDGETNAGPSSANEVREEVAQEIMQAPATGGEKVAERMLETESAGPPIPPRCMLAPEEMMDVNKGNEEASPKPPRRTPPADSGEDQHTPPPPTSRTPPAESDSEAIPPPPHAAGRTPPPESEEEAMRPPPPGSRQDSPNGVRGGSDSAST